MKIISIAVIAASLALSACSSSSDSDSINSAGNSVVPSAAPNQTFIFDSAERAARRGTFDVSLWFLGNRCVARLTSTQAEDLASLQKSIEVGHPGARLSVGAEILSRCSKRFVYLDGSTGTPNQWSEYIGMELDNVEHSVGVSAASAESLVIEVRPGKAPAQEHEVARLRTLIGDVDKALQTYPSDDRLRGQRLKFVSALAELTSTSSSLR